MEGKLQIDGVFSPVVNFAMQQNYVPVIRKLTLKNKSEETLENLKISVVTSPDFAAEWQREIAGIPAGETADLGAVPPDAFPGVSLCPDGTGDGDAADHRFLRGGAAG